MSIDKTKDPNKLFKVRLGQGEVALRILLSGGGKGQTVRIGNTSGGSDRNPKQGTLKPVRKPNTIVGRRKTPQGINLYDMGQMWNGTSWDDLNFQVLTDPISVPTTLVIPPLTTSDYNNRDATFLSVPTDDWFTTFRKITKGTLSSKYALFGAFTTFFDLLDNLTQWQDGGLILTQAQVDSGLSILEGAVYGSSFFFNGYTVLDGQANVKITGTQDYTDPSVAFTPSPKMDIFMPPNLGIPEGQITTTVFGDNYLFGELYLTFPRRFIINTNDDYAGGQFPPIDYTAQTIAAIDNWQDHISGRGYYFDASTSLWTLATFPPASPEFGAMGYVGGEALAGPVNGVLLMVVKKGPNFYYFWTDGF